MPRLKILMAHNHYQQAGGEDGVVEAEAAILRAKGHEVVMYVRRNDELKERGLFGNVRAGLETTWAARSRAEISALIKKERPQIAHFHNTFPLISPAAYSVCREAGVPVVQTLHNFRLLCPSATLMREGRVCESCLGRAVAWPGVLWGCYRGSRFASGAVACMLATHRMRGTWREDVTLYVALSKFAERKFVEGGLPADRIVVKPNFVEESAFGNERKTGGALFVGRLSEEKGIEVMLDGWEALKTSAALRIAGDGPLGALVDARAGACGSARVEVLGRLSPEQVRQEMADARFLVLPSVCYENFPISIAEAFAAGLPVIASRLGAMAEIVEDGVTGLHFEAGNTADLAAKVEWAWEHPEEMQRMGIAARAEYEAKYTPERNYQMLMEIYERAIASRH